MKKIIIAVIQARMGSKRLPGKVLMKIGRKPALQHVIERVRKAKGLTHVILATSRKPENIEILKLAKKLKVPVYFGSEDDVLDRYYKAAKKYGADVVLRIMGDCPFVDPHILTMALDKYYKANGELDFVGFDGNSFPDGLDFDLFSFGALEKSWEEATLPSEREHIAQYVIKHPDIFKLAYIKSPVDYHHIRLTLDEKEDLQFLRKLYFYSKGERQLYLEEIVLIIKEHPELLKINSRYVRNEGLRRSISSESNI